MILHAFLHQLYSLLFALVLPLLYIRLCYKSLRNHRQLEQIGERFGFYKKTAERHFAKTIWLHAVSLGESKAAVPLINYLLQNYASDLVITNMTLTGMQCIRREYSNEPRITQLYVPYDAAFIVRRFLKHINPKICLLMETEIWPSIIYECVARKIPLVILNARLSSKSLMGYQKYGFFFTAYFNKISMICAQSAQDLQSFAQLGVRDHSLANVGNLKFDLTLPDNLLELSAELQRYTQGKFIWVVASTHHNEEEMVLQAFDLLSSVPNLLLIIIPRHPERFNLVENLLQQQKRQYVRKTKINYQQPLTANIILGDTIGELLMYYALADLCLVGGSMVPIGGHNLLEPAMLQKAIITGAYLDNFVELSQKLLDAKGLVILPKTDTVKVLASTVINLEHDKIMRAELAAKAYQTVLENKGALARTAVILTNYL